MLTTLPEFGQVTFKVMHQEIQGLKAEKGVRNQSKVTLNCSSGKDMNEMNSQNVQFSMPNNFRKYPLTQEQFKDFQALLYNFKALNSCFQIQGISKIFKFCAKPAFLVPVFLHPS